jgi:hypothetical protein
LAKLEGKKLRAQWHSLFQLCSLSKAPESGAKRCGRETDSGSFDAKFGNWVIDPASFTRLVYEGV